jgi:ribosomal protein S18 acetylase RimI-like enzyme
MSENMIKIRKARLDDVVTILTLWPELVKTQNEIVEKHCPQHLDGFCLKKNSDEIFRDSVRKMIHSKNGLVLLSEIDEKPVGFSTSIIKKNFPIFQLEKFGYIAAIFVREEFRDWGISSKLKDETFKWLRRKGIKKVSLNVLQNNSQAIKVYEKWGFSTFLSEMSMDL